MLREELECASLEVAAGGACSELDEAALRMEVHDHENRFSSLCAAMQEAVKTDITAERFTEMQNELFETRNRIRACRETGRRCHVGQSVDRGS